jgi:hypothetical protein
MSWSNLAGDAGPKKNNIVVEQKRRALSSKNRAGTATTKPPLPGNVHLNCAMVVAPRRWWPLNGEATLEYKSIPALQIRNCEVCGLRRSIGSALSVRHWVFPRATCRGRWRFRTTISGSWSRQRLSPGFVVNMVLSVVAQFHCRPSLGAHFLPARNFVLELELVTAKLSPP